MHSFPSLLFFFSTRVGDTSHCTFCCNYVPYLFIYSSPVALLLELSSFCREYIFDAWDNSLMPLDLFIRLDCFWLLLAVRLVLILFDSLESSLDVLSAWFVYRLYCLCVLSILCVRLFVVSLLLLLPAKYIISSSFCQCTYTEHWYTIRRSATPSSVDLILPSKSYA
jgi:hypothetical protein